MGVQRGGREYIPSIATKGGLDDGFSEGRGKKKRRPDFAHGEERRTWNPLGQGKAPA